MKTQQQKINYVCLDIASGNLIPEEELDKIDYEFYFKQ